MTTVNVSSLSGRTVQVSYLGAYAGTAYPSVTMVDPITGDPASVAYQTTHLVVAGDIFEWDDVNSLGNLNVDSSGLVSADTEGSFEGRWFDDGDQVYGDWETYTVEVPVTVVPQGAWTIGTITKDKNSASLSPTYSLSDADSYEYSFDGGAWTTFTTTISLTILEPGTAYSGQVRAVNAIGNGAAANFSFTTDALQPPVNAPVYGSETITYNSISLPFTHSGGDATGFEYRLDGGAWQSVTSPISLTSLPSETDHLIETSAINDDGRGPVASITLTTLAAPDYNIRVNSRQTGDTTPVITGWAGDAQNVVVTVNAVEYTPTPVNGAWSIQLPELAADSYAITMDAEDGDGSPLTQVQGLLVIVAIQGFNPRRMLKSHKRIMRGSMRKAI